MSDQNQLDQFQSLENVVPDNGTEIIFLEEKKGVFKNGVAYVKGVPHAVGFWKPVNGWGAVVDPFSGKVVDPFSGKIVSPAAPDEFPPLSADPLFGKVPEFSDPGKTSEDPTATITSGPTEAEGRE